MSVYITCIYVCKYVYRSERDIVWMVCNYTPALWWCAARCVVSFLLSLLSLSTASLSVNQFIIARSPFFFVMFQSQRYTSGPPQRRRTTVAHTHKGRVLLKRDRDSPCALETSLLLLSYSRSRCMCVYVDWIVLPNPKRFQSFPR